MFDAFRIFAFTTHLTFIYLQLKYVVSGVGPGPGGSLAIIKVSSDCERSTCFAKKARLRDVI